MSIFYLFIHVNCTYQKNCLNLFFKYILTIELRKLVILHHWMFETKCVGDNYKMLVTIFGHQHQLSFYISFGLPDFGHQHSKDVTNNAIQSPTSTNRHQHPLVTNITVAEIVQQQTFRKPHQW